MKNGYKRTEADETPKGWQVQPLGRIAKFTAGVPISVEALQGRSADCPVPAFGGNGIAGYTHNAVTTEPTIVVGRVGQKCGMVYYTDGPAWITDNALYPQRFYRSVDMRFLAFALERARLNDVRNRNDLPLVTQAIVHAVQIPLPSDIAEQRAIAEALSDADALIESLEQLLAKKRDLKQAAMQQLLTGKQRLPGFSGEWEVKRLGTLLRFPVGFPFSSAFFNEKGEGARLVRNRDLKSDGQIIHYSGEYDDAYVVGDGDVLVGMDGEFIPCLWKQGFALLNQRVGRIVPSAGLHSAYAYYGLIEPLKKIEIATSSTTVKHLSHGDVEDIECPMPEFDEQTAIAEVLSDMDAELAALEQRRGKTRALKQGMMQELLTGRIRLV